MKKYFVLSGIVIAALIFANCNSARKATAAAIPKSTYATDVTALVTSYCTPCHIPDKGGNKKPYDNFANAKTDIDEMIRRIEMNPGEKGYMPFKKPKLNDSTIMAFKKWRDDGLLEK
ncbi:MAG: hypothetical protein SGI83_11535 [Bacteroidota bacterium]|nr:hypothetical protein [Bacteroidota bacterium]